MQRGTSDSTFRRWGDAVERRPPLLAAALDARDGLDSLHRPMDASRPGDGMDGVPEPPGRSLVVLAGVAPRRLDRPADRRMDADGKLEVAAARHNQTVIWTSCDLVNTDQLYV